jgi:hypothetical protein
MRWANRCDRQFWINKLSPGAFTEETTSVVASLAAGAVFLARIHHPWFCGLRRARRLSFPGSAQAARALFGTTLGRGPIGLLFNRYRAPSISSSVMSRLSAE